MELNQDNARAVAVPPRLNAEAFARFREDVDRIDADCRVVILHGTSGVFCSGMDLGGVAGDPVSEEELMMFAQTLLDLRRLPQPVIAAVEGDATGGGAGIAAAADIVLAEEQVNFGLPEALFGLVPAVIMPFLRERVGTQRLRSWVLQASTVRAETAGQWGLVDQVVPTGTMTKGVAKTIKNLIRCAPESHALIKRALLPVPERVETELKRMIDITAESVKDPNVVRRIERWQAGELPWAA